MQLYCNCKVDVGLQMLICSRKRDRPHHFSGHGVLFGIWQQKQQGDVLLVESPSFSCDEFTADWEANSPRRATTENHAMVRAGPYGPDGNTGPWALLASPGIWRDKKISGLLCWAGRGLGLPSRPCVQRGRQDIDHGGEERKLWWIYSSDKEREALLWERDGCR